MAGLDSNPLKNRPVVLVGEALSILRLPLPEMGEDFIGC